jgi:hypothetical protein
MFRRDLIAFLVLKIELWGCVLGYGGLFRGLVE